MFGPLLADPKKPRFQVSALRVDSDVRDSTVAAVGFGENFSIARWPWRHATRGGNSTCRRRCSPSSIWMRRGASSSVSSSGRSGRYWNLPLEFYDGPSPYGQFYTYEVRYWGPGLVLHLRTRRTQCGMQ